MDLTGKTLILLSILATEPVLKDDYGVAADNARRALLMYPEVKSDMKDIERTANNELYKLTGLDKADLTYAAWTIPVITGRLSTRPFRRLKYENEYVVIRPEIVYDFKSDEFNGMMIFIFKIGDK